MALYWVLFAAIALQSGIVYGQDFSSLLNILKSQSGVVKSQGNLALNNLQQTINDVDISETSKIADDLSSLTDVQSQLNNVLTSLKTIEKVQQLINSLASAGSGFMSNGKKAGNSLMGGLF